MDTILYPGEIINRGDKQHVPIQPQHHASDAEWEEIKFKEYQTHQRNTFLHEGCDQQRRNVGGILTH